MQRTETEFHSMLLGTPIMRCSPIKSMDMEQSALPEIFGWENSMKLLAHMSIVENPFARQGIAATRRPSFTHAEYIERQS
jgi:hypothetical protein